MTREYKYLGLLVTPSMNLNTILSDLKDRALRAIAAMKTKLGSLFRRSVTVSLHLFDSLIKPILLYGSDFWGCLTLPKINPIENVQIRFCKELLGVQKQTHNAGVLLEMGRIPLSIFGKKNCIKNWERIVLKKANRITSTSYDYNLASNMGWPRAIKESVSKIGLLSIFINKRKTAPNNIVFNREKDIFHQDAFSQTQQTSKLKAFTMVKTDIGIEEYLTEIKNVSDRTSLSKLRLSNHCLMIEKGRHEGTEPNKRFCPFCPSQIEDEYHFLVKCSMYIHLRNNLFTEIKNAMPDFYSPPDDKFLFWFLLKCPIISLYTSHFVSRAFDLRFFLLAQHKNTW